MRRSLDHVLKQCPVRLRSRLWKMAKLVSNLITLVLSLAFFGGVNAGGLDKDQKNESDQKTEVDLDLIFGACGGKPAGIVLGSRYLL